MASSKLTEVEHSLTNTLTKYVAYASGYFDAVKADGTRGINWRHVGVFGAVALGVSALTTLSLLQFYSPFPRGKRQRAVDSRPFRDEFSLPKELEHQFYTPDEFQFIQLSQGRVRYFLRHRGARSEKVVVLVHGFSIASDIWKQQADYLVQQGHTVLSFDNYGRGWSDAPDNIAYDQELYIGQLAELLFALNITKTDRSDWSQYGRSDRRELHCTIP